MTAYKFDLLGGRSCLDLANTLEFRGTDRECDRLMSMVEVVNWARQANVLPADELIRLERHAAAHPRQAASAVARLAALRDRITVVFSARATGKPMPAGLLAEVSEYARIAATRRRLEASGAGAIWVWQKDSSPDLDVVLWRVAWSAAELLTSPEIDRIRLCGAEKCGWLFLDTSKNRTRRWCDMKVCGNRSKARRHYAKVSAPRVSL